MMMANYVAVTDLEVANGLYIVARGSMKKRAAKRAREFIFATHNSRSAISKVGVCVRCELPRLSPQLTVRTEGSHNVDTQDQ